MKKTKSIFILMLAMAMTFQVAGINVEALEEGVVVNVDNHRVVIGNDYLEREFLTEDGHLRTSSLYNSRIDETLIPQEGSEDFLIETLVETKDEDVVPTQELKRDLWNGNVSAKNSDYVVDARNMFDGNDSTETDYYKVGTDYPYTLEIDLGEEQSFHSFSYQKRAGNANVAWGINGTVGKYRLQVSNDRQTWTDAGQGEFTREDYNLHQVGDIFNVGDLVYGNFNEEYTARYVRLISDSGALSAEKTFNGAEFRLYEDQYVPVEKPQKTIRSSELTLKDTVVTNIENGGKKLDFVFEPYTFNDVTWNITYVVVMEAKDHFMRSYVEATVDKEDKARIDYIDIEHFILPDNVKGLWYRPDDFKVPEGAYNFLHTEMLLGEPIYADGMFFGSEFPATDTKVEKDTMQIRYYSGKSIAQLRDEKRLTKDGKFVTWPNVIGAAQGTEMNVVQSDFYNYIDSISTKTSFRKQYNSWYDNRMGITDERIASTFYGTEKGLANQGYEPLDSYVVDDGWNNYNDPVYTGIDVERSGHSYNQTGFWEFNDKFPNELYTASSMADKFDASFGLWLGPQGGYELQGTFSQYIGSSNTGYVHPTAALGKVICTGSKKYITNLTTLFTDYQKRFDIDYWKLDGFASRPCVQTNHDHMTGGYNNMYFTSEMWENWTDAFEAMRAQREAEGKDLYINATCYVIPSPWILQWVNAVWQHNAGDLEQDGTNGGSAAQKMISGRDNIYFRNDREAQLQMPLKNVYNHEPIYGSSAGVSMNDDEFRQYMMANAVRGTSFWELYFSPSMMNEEKWMITTDVLTWAEENEDILQHAKLFGNAPKTGSVYGYSSWNEDEGIISFRNPTKSEKTYTLRLDESVGVTKEVKNVKQIQILPYASGLSERSVSYGDEVTVTLKPYEELIYQYTNTENQAPKIVSAKVMNDHVVRVKFDRQIKNENVYQLNGKKAEMKLLADYRTVELTAINAFNEGENIEVSIDGLHSINGKSLNTEVQLTYYKDHEVVKVEHKDDLQNATDLKEQVFERNGVNFFTIDEKSYTPNNKACLDENTKDFSISMILQTISNNATILKQDGMTLSIDEEGYLVYQDGVTKVSSKEEVTTVVEKAHGKFGSEEYVPTTSQSIVKGKINDGNKHLIHVVRELNGMVKLYVDGKLNSSTYEDGKFASFSVSPMTLGDDNLEAQIADVKVLNIALGYDDIEKAYIEYNLTNADIKISKEDWKIEADSEEMNGASNEGPAKLAIDDNPSTLWHTEYRENKPHCPHWLLIDLGKETSFDKLEYISRNGNGSVRDYTLEISLDKDKWTTIKEGVLEKDGTQILDFEETQNARYIRLNIISSYGNTASDENVFGAVAELSVYKNNSPLTNYSTLKDVLEKAKLIETENYTTESNEIFSNAYRNALDVIGNVNASQKKIDDVVLALNNAMNALVLKTADYTEVDKAITKAEALNPEDYEDFSAVTKAIEAVERDLDITHQKEVDAMAKAIEDAIANLKEKPEEIPVDKGELKEVIAEASQLKKEEYTEATWDVFEKTLAEAKEVLADEEATEEMVKEAVAELEKAIGQLEKKPTIEPEPEPEKPGEGEENEGETTPDTGDTTNATALLMMLIVAGGVLALLNRNKIVKFLSKK